MRKLIFMIITAILFTIPSFCRAMDFYQTPSAPGCNFSVTTLALMLAEKLDGLEQDWGLRTG
jgi:hypothetical protein